MITVVNKYKEPNEGEYIGRGSPLGNPFSHMEGTKAEFKVSTREQSIAWYRAWLIQQINYNNQSVLRELTRLYELAKKGDLKLRCFCSPKSCHGDIIKEFLEARLNKEKNHDYSK